MINLLGTKIVLVMILSLLLIGAMGSGYYYYLMPQQEINNTKLNQLKGDISTKQAEIDRLKYEYDILKDQIMRFSELKKRGFFNAQDRVTAREAIINLTDQVKLLKAALKLPPATVVQNANATAANHTLLKGPMTINLNSISDVTALKYVVAMQKVFPGYLEFKSLKLSRKSPISPEDVQVIDRENPIALVDGTIDFDWWSMASEAQTKANPYFNPVEAAPTTPGVP